MAFSAQEGKGFFQDWLIHFAKPLGFKRFLDVGCGAGLYGDIIRDVFGHGNGIVVDAVEPFAEYVPRHGLLQKYDKVFLEDIRDSYSKLGEYDLIICGDVLEHLTKEDAIRVVEGLSLDCKFLWGALPIKVSGRDWSTGYKQCAEEWVENPRNQHLHDWTMDELKHAFVPMWIVPYVQTGVFLVEGLR